MLITILNKTLINSPVRNCTSLYSTGNKPFSIGANLKCEMKTCGIYKITSPSKKIYIGQSVNIKKRFGQYKKMYNSVKQKRLYNSFKKYGIDKHKFELIHECLISELNDLEVYYMDLFQSLSNKNGLNTLKGGNHNNYGLKRNKNVIDNFKKRGMPKNALPASNKVTSIPVNQISLNGEYVRTWPSIKSAARFHNRTDSAIKSALIGLNKTCAGFMWTYVNPKRKPIKSKSTSINFRKSAWRAILEFDNNGVFIKKWESILHASKEYKMSRNTIKNIMNSNKEIKRFKWENEKYIQLNKVIR